jgi:predicted SnoaL-like aldol condensation-catalyzing enzyme
MPSHKDICVSFLQAAAAGRAREQARPYVAPHFRHHNPYFAGDADSLLGAMDDNARANPHKRLDILHTLEDGNFVAVHSRVQHGPDDLGAAVVHLFRFEGDRVAELWDVGQQTPKDSPNQHGMF